MRVTLRLFRLVLLCPFASPIKPATVLMLLHQGILMRRLPLCLVCVLILSACASKPLDPAAAASPSYQRGYGDGCVTATARSRVYDQSKTRDEKAYAEDDLYKRGWNGGFRECGSKMTQRDPGVEPSVDWKKTGPLN